VPGALRHLVSRLWREKYNSEWGDECGTLFLNGGTLLPCADPLPGKFTGGSGQTALRTGDVDVTMHLQKGDYIRFSQMPDFVTVLAKEPTPPGESANGHTIQGKLLLRDKLPSKLQESDGYYSTTRVPEAARYDGKSIDKHIQKKIAVGDLPHLDTTALTFILIGEKNHALLPQPSRRFERLRCIPAAELSTQALKTEEWVGYMVGLRNEQMAHRESAKMEVADFKHSCDAIELFLKEMGSELLGRFVDARSKSFERSADEDKLNTYDQQWQQEISSMQVVTQELVKDNAAMLQTILQRTESQPPPPGGDEEKEGMKKQLAEVEQRAERAEQEKAEYKAEAEKAAARLEQRKVADQHTGQAAPGDDGTRPNAEEVTAVEAPMYIDHASANSAQECNICDMKFKSAFGFSRTKKFCENCGHSVCNSCCR
jgi:hypothetical protein